MIKPRRGERSKLRKVSSIIRQDTSQVIHAIRRSVLHEIVNLTHNPNRRIRRSMFESVLLYFLSFTIEKELCFLFALPVVRHPIFSIMH